MTANAKKLLFIGDSTSGKTCLLNVFSRHTFPEGYVPTTRPETYQASIEVDGRTVDLTLFDTEGSEHYDRMQALWYPQTDIVVLCFAVDSPNSLDNIQAKWTPEVKQFCPNVPILLLGNKRELRNDAQAIDNFRAKKQAIVSVKDGQATAEKIGAKGYLECSAKTGDGVRKVFETAAHLALTDYEKKPSKRGCSVF